MTTIAVLGTGRMGAAIARRLLQTGHDVTVWNRTASRTAQLADQGARAAESPAAAAKDADIVITMLTDANAVETVLFGPDGAATTVHRGAGLVDMSTIGPEAVGDLARRLPDGVDLVDAPVGGSVAAVAAGRLLVLAGGDDHAVDRVAPVLEVLGTVRRCGGPGAGAAVKLVLNTALVTGIAALADAYRVARAVGVDRDTATEVLASSALGEALARVNAGGAFTIALAGKDLALRALGSASAPMARAAGLALRAVPDQSSELITIVSRDLS